MPNLSGPSPAKPSLIIRGKRVVLPQGEQAAAVHVVDGRIAAITSFDDVIPGCPVHNAGDLIVMPGLVDTHVHINEPGRTDWEGFATATRAAAAGGVTTLIEMPLNSIPATTSVEAYQQKVAAADGQLLVDVGFWGGVVPGNTHELAPLWEAGAFGFKCFLVPSGVDEFQSVTEGDLREALPELAKLGAPLLVHAELPGPIDRAASRQSQGASPQDYSTWLESRPREAEDKAIALLLDLAREYGSPIHVVHLSSSNSIDSLQQAKAEGLRVSVETCPHYLTFCAEEIRAGSTQFKCAPPIREAANRDALWRALSDATIDFIASDHSPCPPAMKLLAEGDFLRAWGGISSLQIELSAVWTAARSRGYSVACLSEWMCTGPARLAGLNGRKGSIAVGCDADFAIWNLHKTFHVAAEKLHHKNKLTPYAGRELTGAVETTFLRGEKIFDQGRFPAAPRGRVLRRGLA